MIIFQGLNQVDAAREYKHYTDLGDGFEEAISLLKP